MLSESEAGKFLGLWAVEFGTDELRSEDILARASPGMRIFLAGFLGGRVIPYEVSRFLSVFPRGVYGGGWRLLSRVDRGRTLWCVERVESGSLDIPPAALDVPLPNDLAPSDLLTLNLHRSLHRQAELLELPIDLNDPKTNRLIADVANQTLSAALRAQENSLAAKRDGNRMASPRLMEAVRRAERLAEEDCAGDPANSGGGGLNAL